MLRKSLFVVAAGFALAGCSGDGVTVGRDANGTAADSYFATNVGRLAGHAEALASLCPSLSYNANNLEVYRTAICEARVEGETTADCELPRMDAEKARSFNATLASLNGQSAEQVCARANAEAAADNALAEFLTGVSVSRAATPAY